MAWLDSDWLYRTPLTFANHSGVNAPEGQITIPTAMGKFWENCLSTFNDVRLTAADGVTLLDWAFDGGTPSQANRTATIQIDETSHNVASLYGNEAASASVGAFLYWGNSAASSGWNNSINITTTPKSVLVDLSKPRGTTTVFYLKGSALTLGQVYYATEIRKRSADQTMIYWDLSNCVLRLRRENQQSFRNEEIAYVTFLILDQDGVDTTSAMTAVNSMVICDNHSISIPIKAGDNEKRYNLILTAGLVDEAGGVRIIEQRATLHVQNPTLHPAIT